MQRRAHWWLFLSRQGYHPGEAGERVLKLALLFGERGLLGDQLLVGCLKRCQPPAAFFAVRDAFSPTSNLLIRLAAFMAQSLLNAFRFGQPISQGFQLTDVFLTQCNLFLKFSNSAFQSVSFLAMPFFERVDAGNFLL